MKKKGLSSLVFLNKNFRNFKLQIKIYIRNPFKNEPKQNLFEPQKNVPKQKSKISRQIAA